MNHIQVYIKVMSTVKKLKNIKCLKSRLNKPLRLFFNILCLKLCTYSNFYVNSFKQSMIFYYPINQFCIFEIF